MTDLEFSRLLSDLSESAKKLNQASDSVNDIIKRFQDTLRSMNVGLEVWPVDLRSESWVADDEAGYIDTELGFAKLKGEWVLATRRAKYVSLLVYDEVSDEYVPLKDSRERLISTEDITPLLEEDRSMRIAALSHFPAIAEALKDEATTAIEAIEEAKKLVSPTPSAPTELYQFAENILKTKK